MLSTPIPARPITLSREAALMTSASTLVPLRTIRPSYSAIWARSSSRGTPSNASTSKCSFSFSTPSPEIFSATRTLYLSAIHFSRHVDSSQQVTPTRGPAVRSACQDFHRRGDSLAQLHRHAQLLQRHLQGGDLHYY